MIRQSAMQGKPLSRAKTCLTKPCWRSVIHASRGFFFPLGDLCRVANRSGQNGLECSLLDWDGTLLDSFDAGAQAYIQMFAALALPWRITELKRQYSPNWR